MDWCRLTTDYYLDAAVLRAGEAAEVLFLRCIAYSGAQETRGRIPKHVLPMLTPKGTTARVRALLAEGLVTDDGDALVLKSWERIQEALDTEAERRRRDRERKQRDRDAKKSADTSKESSADAPQNIRPENPRIEVEVEGEKEQHLRSADADPAFDAFWLAYPRKVGKGQARKAWSKALRAAPAETITTAAAAFSAQPGRDPQFTPHPATWLNGERWLDEPTQLRAVASGERIRTVEQMRGRRL